MNTAQQHTNGVTLETMLSGEFERAETGALSELVGRRVYLASFRTVETRYGVKTVVTFAHDRNREYFANASLESLINRCGSRRLLDYLLDEFQPLTVVEKQSQKDPSKNYYAFELVPVEIHVQ